MKVAVVGSRNLSVRDLGEYWPSETTEIISGGARGVDTSAREYANAHGIPITEILPDYKKYPGRVAPLKRWPCAMRAETRCAQKRGARSNAMCAE